MAKPDKNAAPLKGRAARKARKAARAGQPKRSAQMLEAFILTRGRDKRLVPYLILAFVGTLGNSSARITVQEPLSKQLTLVFATNVNESAEQLIQVQYQIDESKSIWATRDESGVFSIVYKIRKRYR